MAVFGKLMPLPVPEVRCLVYRLAVGVLGPPDSDAVLRWSRWRRHQARAQHSYYRRHLATYLLL